MLKGLHSIRRFDLYGVDVRACTIASNLLCEACEIPTKIKRFKSSIARLFDGDAKIKQTNGHVDSVKQLNLDAPPASIPGGRLFPRGTMLPGIVGRFDPQTGCAGDKLWRYLKFRAQPERKLSQGREPPPFYAGIYAMAS